MPPDVMDIALVSITRKRPTPATCDLADTSPFGTVINIHGGAFMLGHAGMVNMDQVRDCLDRSWIVLVPNHRLCPQVNLHEGPMQDCRDLLAWVQDEENGLSKALAAHVGEDKYPLDLRHVFAMGTSSGGTLALSLVRSTTIPLCLRYQDVLRGVFTDEHFRSGL